MYGFTDHKFCIIFCKNGSQLQGGGFHLGDFLRTESIKITLCPLSRKRQKFPRFAFREEEKTNLKSQSSHTLEFPQNLRFILFLYLTIRAIQLPTQLLHTFTTFHGRCPDYLTKNLTKKGFSKSVEPARLSDDPCTKD